MTQHTPGPWQIENGTILPPGWDDPDDDYYQRIIARMWDVADHGLPTDANARLISAAPDLLKAHHNTLRKVDALDRRLVGTRPHPNDVSWAKQIAQDIREIARAAVQLAEGGPR